MTVLLVDVGNSRVKWRFADLDGAAAVLGAACPLATIDRMFDDWKGASVAPRTVLVSNVASVEVGRSIASAVRRLWGDVPIDQPAPKAFECGIVNGYRDAAQLGPDRWFALIGARDAVPHRTLLVGTFGTATTLDLLVDGADPSGRAVFVGGLILPGIEAMRAALVRDTARLPDTMGRIVDFGDRTSDAISSGIMAAQVGAVERAWAAAKRRLVPPAAHPLLVVSGGSAPAMIPLLAELTMETTAIPDLVLLGLQRIASETTIPADMRALFLILLLANLLVFAFQFDDVRNLLLGEHRQPPPAPINAERLRIVRESLPARARPDGSPRPGDAQPSSGTNNR